MSQRFESRARKIARLAVFCLVTGAVGVAAVARAAYGDAQRAALGLGSELGKLGEPGAERVVRINDQAIHVVSAIDPRPFVDVLDQVELACDQRGAGLREVIAALPEPVRARLPDSRGSGSGTMRKEAEREGFVACLVRDEPTRSAGELLDRMEAFARTGDLSAVGHARYVHARATASGGSHVVVAWSDGPLRVTALLPEAGADAPGDDIEGFPRPAGATRLLTARLEGVPYGIRLYRTDAPPEEIVRSYDAQLGAEGWNITRPDDQPTSRAFSRGGVDVMVFAEPSGGATMVSLVDMSRR
jgi:hypothetical protein